MADLVIDGTHEEQWGIIKSTVIQLNSTVKGNGKNGLEKDVALLQTQLAIIETHGRAAVMWAKVIAGMLSILIAGAGLYFASLELRGKQGLLIPSDVFRSNSEDRTYAVDKNRPQLTTNEPRLQ